MYMFIPNTDVIPCVRQRLKLFRFRELLSSPTEGNILEFTFTVLRNYLKVYLNTYHPGFFTIQETNSSISNLDPLGMLRSSDW